MRGTKAVKDMLAKVAGIGLAGVSTVSEKGGLGDVQERE